MDFLADGKKGVGSGHAVTAPAYTCLEEGVPLLGTVHVGISFDGRAAAEGHTLSSGTPRAMRFPWLRIGPGHERTRQAGHQTAQ